MTGCLLLFLIVVGIAGLCSAPLWVPVVLDRWWARNDSPARDGLIDGLIWALKYRPRDFTHDQYYLQDTRAGLCWWIANDDYGFKLTNRETGEVLAEFHHWQKKRAWRAVTAHLQGHKDGKIEALWDKMVEANDAALITMGEMG